MGWITAAALPRNATVTELAFSPIAAIIGHQTKLTDDPLNSQTSVATLAQGTKVNWLANMGEWAYVEGADARLVRGFVKIEALEREAAVE